MFSPVSQISNPSFPLLLTLSSIHFFLHSFPSFLSFDSSSLVSIESGAFNGLDNLRVLSLISLSSSITSSSISFFYSPSSISLVKTLSPPSHLDCSLTSIISIISTNSIFSPSHSSIPLFNDVNFPFHQSIPSLIHFTPTPSPPSLLVCSMDSTVWPVLTSQSIIIPHPHLNIQSLMFFGLQQIDLHSP